MLFINKFAEEKNWQKFIKDYTKALSCNRDIDGQYGIISDEDVWPFIISAFFKHFKVPLMVLVSTGDRAGELGREIKSLDTHSSIYQYPGMGTNIFSKKKTVSSENISSRLIRRPCGACRPSPSPDGGPAASARARRCAILRLATSGWLSRAPGSAAVIVARPLQPPWRASKNAGTSSVATSPTTIHSGFMSAALRKAAARAREPAAETICDTSAYSLIAGSKSSSSSMTTRR